MEFTKLARVMKVAFPSPSHPASHAFSLQELTPGELALRVARAIRKDKVRQRKIAEAGIEYEYPELGSLVPTTSKKTLFE